MKKKNNKPHPPRLAIVPPPVLPPDRTYPEIGDDFARLSIEVASALEHDRLDPDDRRELRTVFCLANQAAIKLQLLSEAQHRRAVAALDDRCLCGWDRGSHLVEAPHLCEEDPACAGFRLALEAVAAADTLPPPADSTPTVVGSLEDVS